MTKLLQGLKESNLRHWLLTQMTQLTTSSKGNPRKNYLQRLQINRALHDGCGTDHIVSDFVPFEEHYKVVNRYCFFSFCNLWVSSICNYRCSLKATYANLNVKTIRHIWPYFYKYFEYQLKRNKRGVFSWRLRRIDNRVCILEIYVDRPTEASLLIQLICIFKYHSYRISLVGIVISSTQQDIWIMT